MAHHGIKTVSKQSRVFCVFFLWGKKSAGGQFAIIQTLKRNNTPRKSARFLKVLLQLCEKCRSLRLSCKGWWQAESFSVWRFHVQAANRGLLMLVSVPNITPFWQNSHQIVAPMKVNTVVGLHKGTLWEYQRIAQGCSREVLPISDQGLALRPENARWDWHQV